MSQPPRQCNRPRSAAQARLSATPRPATIAKNSYGEQAYHATPRANGRLRGTSDCKLLVRLALTMSGRLCVLVLDNEAAEVRDDLFKQFFLIGVGSGMVLVLALLETVQLLLPQRPVAWFTAATG